MMKEYTSDNISVFFEPKKCVHAAECVKGLNKVFDTKKRPWIDPAKAKADEIAEVVERCPSGALTYDRKDGVSNESHSDTIVTVSENKGIYIKGNFKLEINGESHHLNRAILDNTGESENKPFYDKSLSN